MFFGLCNSPATFQAMMDNIFEDMIFDGIIIVYMDNIFLFSPDEETLTKNTKRVLSQLQENDLFLKPTKCEFNKTKVGNNYLRRKNLHGSRKTVRNSRLACPDHGETNSRILRFWKLLPLIHPKFL
jgi:hypothetical protein